MNLKGKNVLVTGIASNRSISFAIEKVLKENDLKSYRAICVNPNDKLDVNGIKVRDYNSAIENILDVRDKLYALS